MPISILTKETYIKNLTIKRKPQLAPSIPDHYSKYKSLSFNSCNLKELYENEISKLSEDDLSQLKNIDCYEIFQNESQYDESVLKIKEFTFKGVDVKSIIEELGKLAERFPNFTLQGGTLTSCWDDEIDHEILQVNIAHGQVEVLVD